MIGSHTPPPQLKRIDKSLIIFVSTLETFSDTHRDDTASILHCLCGTSLSRSRFALLKQMTAIYHTR